MGTWRWFSVEYCASTSSCIVVDAWLQLVLCAFALLFILVTAFVLFRWWFAPALDSSASSRRRLLLRSQGNRGLYSRLAFWRSASNRSKTTPMPLAVIKLDADQAHITSHKNSIKNAVDFIQQTQRISHVDFATTDKATVPMDRSPSRNLSLIDRIGNSFARRRGSKQSNAATSPTDANPTRRKRWSQHESNRRKHSNPLPMGSGSGSGSSRRRSIPTSSLEPDVDLDANACRRPSEAQSESATDGPRRPLSPPRERSSSFRKRIAIVLSPTLFITTTRKPLTPTSTAPTASAPTATTTTTKRGRSATTFDEPSYKARQKVAALSPEHRKKKERRGSVELRDKRRLSVGKEAQLLFQVADGNEASVYEVKLKEITLVKRLAFGPLSEVYAAIWRDTKVGVKLLLPREGVTDKLEEAVRNFRREIWVMNALRHPNIVKLIGASLTPSCYVLVMEYMSNGSLYEYLRDEANLFPASMVITSALDIADGMKHIHASGVLQRDLKSHNCLLSENLVVKVADFGLSRFKTTTNPMDANNTNTTNTNNTNTYTFVGTPFWAAPEVIRHEAYDDKADVYSFAIVLWELVERKDPYDDVRNAFQVPLLVANDGRRPRDFSKPAPLGLAHLMKQCWDADPDQRPTFAEIVETLTKWLAPTNGADATTGDSGDHHHTVDDDVQDLSMHVQRETTGANEQQRHRFASSHDANAKAIPIFLSRGHTDRAISSVSASTTAARRGSTLALRGPPPHIQLRANSERSLSRASNHSAP